jgi:hypothetical protein
MGNSRRLRRAMKATRFRGRMGGYGGVKMSEVLVDFAEPLVEGLSLPEDRDAFVAALKIAGMLWNEAVFPHEGGSRELYDTLNAAMGDDPDPDLEKLFDAVIARRRLLYPHLDRCTVRVVSAV